MIAVFYTSDLNLMPLAGAAVGLVGVWLLQRRDVWRSAPYIVLACVIWYSVYLSGVHATIAGVLMALLMPVYNVRSIDLDRTNEIYHLYRQAPTPGTASVVRGALTHVIPLKQRLSTLLPPYVNFLVVPLFALANAGVALSGESLAAAFGSTITWGVIAGLVIGKLAGVLLGSGIVLRLMPSSRLPGDDLPRIAGVGALSGMGFTISLLVASIAMRPSPTRPASASSSPPSSHPSSLWRSSAWATGCARSPHPGERPLPGPSTTGPITSSDRPMRPWCS